MEQVPRNLGEMLPLCGGHIPGSGQCGLGEMGVPDLDSYPPTRRLSWHRGREPPTHSWRQLAKAEAAPGHSGLPKLLADSGIFFFPFGLFVFLGPHLHIWRFPG